MFPSHDPEHNLYFHEHPFSVLGVSLYLPVPIFQDSDTGNISNVVSVLSPSTSAIKHLRFDSNSLLPVRRDPVTSVTEPLIIVFITLLISDEENLIKNLLTWGASGIKVVEDSIISSSPVFWAGYAV